MFFNNETFWDVKLNIQTAGKDYSRLDKLNYGYDPTPYPALLKLADSGLISSSDLVLDLGCGMGRAAFLLNFETGCSCKGIDFNERLYGIAQKNLNNYRGKEGSVSFECCNAEDYEIGDENRFFFFNPFSAQILRKVIFNIKRSLAEHPRLLRTFFYYPTDEYMEVLFSDSALMPIVSIDCTNLFARDKDLNRILAFEILPEYCLEHLDSEASEIAEFSQTQESWKDHI